MARPLKHGVALKSVTIRMLPRTADAIRREAFRRNISQAELLDRLCQRAGLYKDTEEVGT
jgi:hypothetical protein